MPRSPLLLALLVLFTVGTVLPAAELKIAVLTKHEIEAMIMVRVLAKPENADAKKAIQAADAKVMAVSQRMSGKLQKDESRDEVMKELGAAHQEKSAAEQAVKLQVQGEMIKVVKEVSKGRYVVVLDADYSSESIITKDAEMVDITLDVKEFLLTK